MISDSHPMLTQSSALREYCGHFLKKYDLNYFQVVRVNQDGSTVVLTNRADFTRFAIQHAIKANVPLVYSSVNKESLDANSYYFLWEHNLPTAPVAMVRNEFNMANGLAFVERYPTHYYMIAFAAPTENTRVLDFYLNNIDLIQKFIRGFKEQQQDLLQKIESQPLILPPPLMDENLEEMLLPSKTDTYKRIPVIFDGQKSHLTKQEYECIKQLPLGLTAKQIARNLNISHRSVEKYFERVKNRTGCSNKQELIELIS